MNKLELSPRLHSSIFFARFNKKNIKIGQAVQEEKNFMYKDNLTNLIEN